MTEREYILVSAMRQVEIAHRCLVDAMSYRDESECTGPDSVIGKMRRANGLLSDVSDALRAKIKLTET